MTIRASKVAHSGLVLALAAAIAGCGDDPVAPEFETIETVEFAPALGIDLAQMTELPSGVYVQDLVVGTGATIADGSIATVAYTGWLANGFQFDSDQFDFEYGAAGLIEGWTLGMAGQQEGTTRRIIIPPDLGYGASGRGAIPPGAVLVFEVELISLQ